MKLVWPEAPLEQLTERDSPITYGVIKPGREGSVRFVRGGDIADGVVREEALRTITAEVSEQYKRTLLRGGELLMSLVGQPGQVAVASADLVGANIARQVGLVRLRDDVDPFFISYFLRSPDGVASLGKFTGGSVQQVINLGDLRQVSVPIPAIAEQRRLVAILDEAFEGIATTKANAEKNLKNARELFALQRYASFADGRQSWPTKPLGDVAEVQSGGTPLVSTNAFWGGGIAWYSSGELNNIETSEPERFISEAGLAGSNAKLFPKGSLLVGMYDTAALKMSILDRAAAFNQAIAGVKPNPRFEMEFLFHALNFQKPELLNLRRGVRQKNLSLGKIKEIVVPVPSTQVQRNIVERLRATQELSDHLQSVYRRKLAALDELKKSLLHQAFTGALTSKSTDKQLEAVA